MLLILLLMHKHFAICLWKLLIWLVLKNLSILLLIMGANFKVARRLLNEKYGNICWSPCAAHSFNLIMQDIGKVPHIVSLAQRASKVTVFVYNHKWTLGWLRRMTGWTKILHPRETRFGTTFITLKSL